MEKHWNCFFILTLFLSVRTTCYCGGDPLSRLECNFSDNSICHLGFDGLVGLFGYCVLAGQFFSMHCVSELRWCCIIKCLSQSLEHQFVFLIQIQLVSCLWGVILCFWLVLNRFSKDVGFLDDVLIVTFCEFLQVCWR